MTAVAKSPPNVVPVGSIAGAAQSLFLPLASRAFESEEAHPIVRDDKALELLARLDFDWRPFAKSHLYHTLMCLRTSIYDEAVQEFLKKNPRGTIVNLGCGLDTRFERIDNGLANWIELDFPEVIDIRRELLGEHARRKYVSSSVTDLEWLNDVDARDQPIFFFAEGVFMFVDGSEVRTVVTELARRFAGCQLMFDAVKPIEVRLRRYHPTLRKTDARLRWGLRAAQDVETWHPALRVDRQWFYCEEKEPRLGIYRWLRYLPWVGRTAWILRFNISLPDVGDATSSLR